MFEKTPVDEWHFKQRCMSSTSIFTENVTLPQLIFKHFASKNQLPVFYISGTLGKNGLMKLFLTNLGAINITISFCLTFPLLLSQAFSHKSNLNFITWNWKTFKTHFIRDVKQKSCVLKMAYSRTYLTLSHHQKDNKWVNKSINFFRSKKEICRNDFTNA